MSDFPNDDKVQRSFESPRHFNTKYNAATRKTINNNGLAFVSDESFSEFFTGIYAIYKHVVPKVTPPDPYARPYVSPQNRLRWDSQASRSWRTSCE